MADVTELRKRLASVEGMQRNLDRRRWHLVLEIEEAEGNPDSHRARFARAALSNDLDAMNRLCAENTADTYRKTGKWSEHQEAAEKLIAEGSCPEEET